MASCGTVRPPTGRRGTARTAGVLPRRTSLLRAGSVLRGIRPGVGRTRPAMRLSKSEGVGVYRPLLLGEPLDDKHVGLGHEVVDEPRVDAAARMQRDPVLLVHVVARGDLRV